MVISYCLGIVVLLASGLYCTWHALQCLRIRRQVLELRQEATPQLDRSALIASVWGEILLFGCIVVCSVLFFRVLHLNVQLALIVAFVCASRWINVQNRWDKMQLPGHIDINSDMALQCASSSILTVILCVVAKPLSLLPLEIQLLCVAISSLIVVAAVAILRERIVHQGAFEGAELRQRHAGIKRGAMRYSIGFSAAFTVIGTLFWGHKTGLLPVSSTFVEGAAIFAYFIVDCLISTYAMVAYVSPKKIELVQKPKKQALVNR